MGNNPIYAFFIYTMWSCDDYQFPCPARIYAEVQKGSHCKFEFFSSGDETRDGGWSRRWLRFMGSSEISALKQKCGRRASGSAANKAVPWQSKALPDIHHRGDPMKWTINKMARLESAPAVIYQRYRPLAGRSHVPLPAEDVPRKWDQPQMKEFTQT